MIQDAERCKAILKYIRKWRCRRRAVGTMGLCAQHRWFGCRVPAKWADQGSPIPPVEYVKGRKDAQKES
jgi:hypothetical protein